MNADEDQDKVDQRHVASDVRPARESSKYVIRSRVHWPAMPCNFNACQRIIFAGSVHGREAATVPLPLLPWAGKLGS